MRHSSNYWKKPEQLNGINYCTIVGLHGRKREINRVSYLFQGEIIPDKLIKDKNLYSITYIDEMYHLDGFIVTLENDKILNIKLCGIHPNCDPATDIYCLPDFKKDVDFTSEYVSHLITNVKTYYIDSCYFMPVRKNLKYKKIQSMYIQMNPK